MSTNNLYYGAAPDLNSWLLFKKRFLNAFDMKQTKKSLTITIEWHVKLMQTFPVAVIAADKWL